MMFYTQRIAPQHSQKFLALCHLKRVSKQFYILAVLAFFQLFMGSAMSAELPRIEQVETSHQLIVDGKPFIARGGELGNSTASNLKHLGQFWSKFESLNMNTLVAPVYWDLIEQQEGKFDFSLVDGLIRDAEKHNMKLVLLWFASWKNSMSSYVPEWVKTDQKRFPRARDKDGRAMEILSPFSDENAAVDSKAFAALMKHIGRFDKRRTVIMVQPENEIGMPGIARDHSDIAEKAYRSEVPQALLDYLTKHKAQLTPELQKAWASNGYKTNGNWPSVFGDTLQGEEIFMAWHFARYTDKVASAGKSQHALPMFVNAALIRPGYQPGQYVSAGPLPHLINVWRAGAPNIDFIAPDIYFPNFTEWTEKYTRYGNPLFIPEALRNQNAAVNAMYAFAQHDAMGFSPFGIEAIEGIAEPLLAESYKIIAQLEPLITKNHGKGSMRGFLQISDMQKQPQKVRLGGYEMNVKFEYATPPSLADGVINESGDVSRGPSYPAGGLVIHLDGDEFLFAGIGITITFESFVAKEQVGIVSAESGHFVKGKWENLIWNNGDQTHQGRHVRLVPGRFDVQKVKLYRYR